jgi:pimeloyl-ACP methyl ester carboxylesterase
VSAIDTRRIDVGGRFLNMECRGAGSPAVVFELGAGQTMRMCAHLADALAPVTQVITYDRAGRGGSDRAPKPRPAQHAVDDLHVLLSAGGVQGPFVLVGMSLGGLLVRLYASQHPEHVAGIVLVDASHEDQGARYVAAWGDYPLDMGLRVVAWQEGYDFDDLCALVRHWSVVPDVPVTVLTRTPGRRQGYLPEWPDDAVRRLDLVLQKLQADLANRVAGSVHITADNSGHDIGRDQPQLVVDAVRDIVEKARRRKPLNVAGSS